jgi:hypothetical protein
MAGYKRQAARAAKKINTAAQTASAPTALILNPHRLTSSLGSRMAHFSTKFRGLRRGGFRFVARFLIVVNHARLFGHGCF